MCKITFNIDKKDANNFLNVTMTGGEVVLRRVQRKFQIKNIRRNNHKHDS